MTYISGAIRLGVIARRLAQTLEQTSRTVTGGLAFEEKDFGFHINELKHVGKSRITMFSVGLRQHPVMRDHIRNLLKQL